MPLVSVFTKSKNKHLLEWLGVESKPRAQDLVARIQALAAAPPMPKSRRQIQTIYKYLAENWQRFTNDTNRFAVLQTLAWLPTDKSTDRWYKPTEVFAVFRRYLFETEANFLDVDSGVQGTANRGFNQFLGIQSEPSVGHVVRYLKKSASERRRTINIIQVLRFLNDKVDMMWR